MEDDVVHISLEDIEIMDASEYSEDLTKYFSNMPDVARPLLVFRSKNVRCSLKGDQKICQTAHAPSARKSV